MIDYPEDQQLREQASRHDLQAPVLIRDIVRVVEVLNLRAERFFNKRSVLSGSMALRCFGSPRFTSTTPTSHVRANRRPTGVNHRHAALQR
jgi:hypothetical protein